MSIKLHHVGHVVKNLEEGMKLYENLLGLTHEQLLGSTPGGKGVRKYGNGRLVLIPIGEFMIELIEPDLTVESRQSRLLRERGEGLYHLAIFVQDFDIEVKRLREKGFSVEVSAVPGIFPGITIRRFYLEVKETHGVPIEFVDLASIPHWDRLWYERMKNLEGSAG